jgi:hypothetical protein
MSATVRNAGHQWLVEVDGELIGAASTEAEALVLAEQCIAQRKWIASWRFGSQRVDLVESEEPERT